MNRTLVWFRRDLRLSDHAPLERAARRGQVIPVFVLDPALLHHPETGVARVAFMLGCLGALDRELRQRGGRLIVRRGDPLEILPQLVHSSQAEGIYAYSDCERIYGRARDARLNRILASAGIKIRWFDPVGSVPEFVSYPRYRQLWFEQMADPLIPTPIQVAVPEEISSEPIPSLAELGLTPDEKRIPAGSTAAARQTLNLFLRHKAQRYYWQLSYPSAEVTTGLSPYLKFGVISVRECVQTVQQAVQGEPDERKRRSAKQLISRLRWGSGFTQRFRYLPQLELSSLYSVFDQQGWNFDPELYRAWQEGRTGFPIVDAAARCLLTTGGYRSLNFRVRAIYASFLSNLLGMDWRYGALHFMRHLIDGDCPIDHYQWAMQAGVTHCVDKPWTRIYRIERKAQVL
ncbi:deoxyribodipyrimidine photo-lyase [Thermostichus vulcanus]|uniref:Deoxyribodipyrimidine photo-lyase n=1 Tax=Thermostichus vulcanus str. 'Rupite' TaxID=2813851 RepID=A0ABT0CER9_THEVL|nr:deoxyribodipyrimidine photo-lyase [Thermostichus vulcanus]MCJ2544212.1 deoxyribodipyrimidine photo-lyase [Thermostichus vulcanus str. 'Rupite']